jgi:polyribonucleotide nucleotidyltransferase
MRAWPDEIGHGALAERAIAADPRKKRLSCTIRVVSEVLNRMARL